MWILFHLDQNMHGQLSQMIIVNSSESLVDNNGIAFELFAKDILEGVILKFLNAVRQ